MNKEDKILKMLEQMQTQLLELNSKVDNNHLELNSKIDNLHSELNSKINKNHTEVMTKLNILENKFDDLEPKNATRHIDMINRIDSLSSGLTIVEAISGKNMADIANLKLIK